MSEKRFSIIMIDFAGKWTEFASTARQAFGRDGLDAFSLTIRREQHLPAEIADRLGHSDAERIAAALRAAGAQVEVVLKPEAAHDVQEVKIQRPKRANLTAEELLKRMEAFSKRKEQIVAAVRKSKDRSLSA